MTVQYIRCLSGENVIADVVEESADTLTLRNAIISQMIDEKQLGFAPWAPLQDPALNEVTIPKTAVIFVTDAAPQIVEQYQQMFSTIISPTKNLIL